MHEITLSERIIARAWEDAMMPDLETIRSGQHWDSGKDRITGFVAHQVFEYSEISMFWPEGENAEETKSTLLYGKEAEKADIFRPLARKHRQATGQRDSIGKALSEFVRSASNRDGSRTMTAGYLGFAKNRLGQLAEHPEQMDVYELLTLCEANDIRPEQALGFMDQIEADVCAMFETAPQRIRERMLSAVKNVYDLWVSETDDVTPYWEERIPRFNIREFEGDVSEKDR